ncbi:MAG TPA: glycosyltransferase [Candidatus Eisenbacteria bacterium]|nr:glycosyltransferase [Candidatus Eisenbacteria bacterium]
MSLKVLAVVHEAYPGAPSAALDVCRFMSVRLKAEFKFILLRGGPIKDDFESVGEVLVLRNASSRVTGLRSGLAFLRDRLAVAGLCARWRPSVLYLSSILSVLASPVLRPLGLPAVLHVYELDAYYPLVERRMNAFKSWPKLYLATSEAVCRHLTEKIGVEPSKVALAYGAIDAERVLRLAGETPAENLRAGWDALVGGAGRDWRRKGVDLWLKAAAAIRARMPGKKIRFVWIGEIPEEDRARLLAEAGETGDSVRFLGFLANPYPFYAQFDVFLMTSREDPLPLVVMESLLLEKPVLCFEGRGGSPEVVRSDAGASVPFPDTERMAGEAARFLSDAAARTAAGKTGRRRVLETHEAAVLAKTVRSALEGAAR